MILPLAVKYGLEIPGYSSQFRDEVRHIDIGDLTLPIALGDVGSAVFGASIYDLGNPNITYKDKDMRQRSRLLGGLSMKYMNLLDDAIDDPSLALSTEEKRTLITLSVGQTWSTIEGGTTPNTFYFKAAKVLGAVILKDISSSTQKDSYVSTVYQFAEVEAAQAEDMTPEGLLKSVVDVGRPCGGIMAKCAEVVTGRKDFSVHLAAESLGVYGMLLDHAYEVNADLRDNSNTIVTEMIKREGDSTATRKAARELCLDHANDYLRLGATYLNKHQKGIYLAMARLFEIRYKILQRVTDSLIQIN